MNDGPRKKSPRAPSMDLQEALERTARAYDKERLHPAPVDVVAKHLGYTSANSGTALAALASLRYYGLIERPRDGVLAVVKDFENYKFSPNADIRGALVAKFLRTPPLFHELLDRFENGFPSDDTLKFELIQMGFLPASAGAMVSVLKKSVEFAELQKPLSMARPDEPPLVDTPVQIGLDPAQGSLIAGSIASDRDPNGPVPAKLPAVQIGAPSIKEVAEIVDVEGQDRIPVRLHGNRRAWLLIPAPFFEADKRRLKAQIDLLLTDDDEL